MSPPQNGIFVRTIHDMKKDLRLSKSVTARDVHVANGEMIVVTSSNCILHVTVATTQNTTEKPHEISLPLLSSDCIESVHVSPCGRHCLISSKGADNLYFNVKTNQAFALKKIKGLMTAVAWNPDLGNADTGPILLGTSKGGIIEVNISSNGNVLSHKDHPWIGIEKELPVSNIYLHIINDDEPKNSRWSLLICIPGRVYVMQSSIDMTTKVATAYVGMATLQTGWVVPPERDLTIFGPFFTQKVDVFCLTSHEGSSPLCSSLILHPDGKDAGKWKFVWLGEGGLTVGTVNMQADRSRSMIVEERTVDHRRVDGTVELPVGISLSQYHVLLLFHSRLTALSFYTANIVYEDNWPRELGTASAICTDETSQLHWITTTKSILKYRSNDEARYVWNVYLERGDYVKALGVARERRTIDAEAYELVLKRQADKYILDKNFGAAAEILAQSSEPFETIVLRLISAEENGRTGLKTLLDKKLEQFSRESEDKIRKDVIFMWLLEMQLSEIASVRLELTGSRDRGNEGEDSLKELNKQLQLFLRRKNVQDTIKSLRDAIYRTMLDHADFESQLIVATTLRDFEMILKIRLGREQYREALELLNNVGSAELFYQFAPLLLTAIPIAILEVIKDCRDIRPSRMVPILCEAARDDSIARNVLSYVDWSIQSPSATESLHNIFVEMLARLEPSNLLKYLQSQGDDRSMISYDLHFAIRSARQYDLKECLVYLYCLDDMWMEAVQLALEGVGSIEIAKECANWMDRHMDDEMIKGTEGSSSDGETRKSVWLKIATVMIENKEDAGVCLRLLTQSNDAIKIQDMLPLLPDFTKMEHFKEPLVACLTEHSRKIEELQRTMKEATETAQEIREKTEKMRKRVMVVRWSDTCSSCRLALCTRPFYAHACKHLFHRDCMEREMMTLLDEQEKKTLNTLVEKERKLLIEIEYGEKMKKNGVEQLDKEQKVAALAIEIGWIVGKECPLCSNLAIEQIDLPFFTEEEYEEEVGLWSL